MKDCVQQRQESALMGGLLLSALSAVLLVLSTATAPQPGPLEALTLAQIIETSGK
jgi:hypothetical protein